MSTASKTLQKPKLSRAEAIALVKEEEPSIDFGLGSSDAACSTSQLVYLRELGARISGFKRKPDFPGSMGRAVYEHLMNHRFIVHRLFTKGLMRKWLPTNEWMNEPFKERAYFTAEAARQALDVLRTQQPERKHKILEVYTTQYEYDHV